MAEEEMTTEEPIINLEPETEEREPEVGGQINAQGKQIINVAEPMKDDQAATKKYVDDNVSWEKIEEKTLTANTTTITFDNIPTIYRFLRLRAIFGMTGVTYASMRLNNDTGANYYYTLSVMRGGAFTAASTYGSGATNAIVGRTTTTIQSTFEIVFSQPSSTERKAWTGLFHEAGSDGGFCSGAWIDTSNKITRIDLLDLSGNAYQFLSGSVFILEGYK